MTNDLPFYSLFEALRKDPDNSLGLGDYFILIEALQGGFGMDRAAGKITKDRLRQLCKTLWLKPSQSPRVFEEVFEQYCLKAGKLVEGEHDFGTRAAKTAEAQKSDTNPPPPIEEGTPPARETNTAVEKIRVRINLGTPDGEHTNISRDKPVTEKRTLLFTDDFFPLSKRQVQQVWRFLPDTMSVAGRKNLDLETTVQAMAGTGYLARLFYQLHKQTINQVILLTDHQGSMIAFDPLTSILVETLQKAFKDFNHPAQNVMRYYFHNVPQDYVYENQFHTLHRSLEDLTAKYRNKRCVLLIISDAGAARGGNSNHRVKATIRALVRLERITSKIAWINPMPKERWAGTSAERIANFVRMFDTTPLQLQQAVAVLRGRTAASLQ